MAPVRPVLQAPARESARALGAAAQQKRRVEEAAGLPSLQISADSLAYLSMLGNGSLSPLGRFMSRQEYASVMETMRLPSGKFCPVPVLLPAGDPGVAQAGRRLALRDVQNRLVGCMRVEEVFEGTPYGSTVWPGARSWNASRSRVERVVSGALEVFEIPARLQFPSLWRGPVELRREMAGRRVIAVDSWEPRDVENTHWLLALAQEREAVLLFNLAAEPSMDAVRHHDHLRACVHARGAFFEEREALLNLLPVGAVFSSEREILWRAMVHRNFGASSYVVDLSQWRGPGPAGALRESEALKECASELGVELVFRAPRESARRELVPVAKGQAALAERPRREPVPLAVRELEKSLPVLRVPGDWGLCLWFTGLPCSGKSTIAGQLTELFTEQGLRVSVLDGDNVRMHLSKGLTFSREDRDTNVQRIGFVASEIVKHGGVVICAAVSPWRESRERVREMMPVGSFVEVFVDTPVEECERRDVKGFYARARAGLLTQFTGVDDPYELPLMPEIAVRTSGATGEESARAVLEFLLDRQYMAAAPGGAGQRRSASRV